MTLYWEACPATALQQSLTPVTLWNASKTVETEEVRPLSEIPLLQLEEHHGHSNVLDILHCSIWQVSEELFFEAS